MKTKLIEVVYIDTEGYNFVKKQMNIEIPDDGRRYDITNRVPPNCGVVSLTET